MKPVLALAALMLPLLAMPVKAQSPDHGHAHMLWLLQADQFELRNTSKDQTFVWDVHGWIGTDDDKFLFKSEGALPTDGALEKAEIQGLYAWRVSEFWDAQAGLRYDYRPGPRRGFLALGMRGLAPYFIEVDATAFVSHKGEVSARVEADYDLYLTQSVVLQPSAELNLAAQNVRERGVGAGISEIELGLRLRFEIEREFAPYIGVSWERKLFRAARYARDEGEDASTLALVMGVRFRF